MTTRTTEEITAEIALYYGASSKLMDLVAEYAVAYVAALASPDPAEWTEGARAEREATVRWLTNINDGRGMFRSRNALAEELAALPLPSAPVTAPKAPEAKTAESEVGWIVRSLDPATLADLLRRAAAPRESPYTARLLGIVYAEPIVGAKADRCRLTVAPAPVGPEETPR